MRGHCKVRPLRGEIFQISDICVNERQEEGTKRCNPEITYRHLKRPTSSQSQIVCKRNENMLTEAAAADLVVCWEFTASVASTAT